MLTNLCLQFVGQKHHIYGIRFYVIFFVTVHSHTFCGTVILSIWPMCESCILTFSLFSLQLHRGKYTYDGQNDRGINQSDWQAEGWLCVCACVCICAHVRAHACVHLGGRWTITAPAASRQRLEKHTLTCWCSCRSHPDPHAPKPHSPYSHSSFSLTHLLSHTHSFIFLTHSHTHTCFLIHTLTHTFISYLFLFMWVFQSHTYSTHDTWVSDRHVKM